MLEIVLIIVTAIILILIVICVIVAFDVKRIAKILSSSNPQENQEFMDIANPIVSSNSFQKLKSYVQHGKVSTFDHVINVAYIAFCFAKEHPKFDLRSMTRGALLHDFYLYDWHEKNAGHRLHGFRHPYRALANACSEHSLNKIEKDIILKHMFPLTFYLWPRYKESYAVSRIDKRVSLYETIYRRKN